MMKKMFFSIFYMMSFYVWALPQPSSYNPANLPGIYRLEIYDPVNNSVVFAYSFTRKTQSASQCSVFYFKQNKTYSVRLIGKVPVGKNFLSVKQDFIENHGVATTTFASANFNVSKYLNAGYFTRKVKFSENDISYKLYGRLNNEQFNYTIPIQIKW